MYTVPVSPPLPHGPIDEHGADICLTGRRWPQAGGGRSWRLLPGRPRDRLRHHGRVSVARQRGGGTSRHTVATDAILFVLIAMLGPVSGAHMTPAVTFAGASRGEIPGATPPPSRSAGLLRDPGRLGGAPDVRPSGAPAVGEGAHRPRPVGWGSGRHLRPGPDDPRHLPPPARRGPGERRPRHHRGLLVHLLHQLRQPGDRPRPRPLQHLSLASPRPTFRPSSSHSLRAQQRQLCSPATSFLLAKSELRRSRGSSRNKARTTAFLQRRFRVISWSIRPTRKT